MKKPTTLQQAIVYFSDPQRAFDYAVKLRWPDGKVTCPRCGGAKHSFIKTRRIWFCYDCQKQFTVKVGTIFEDSPIGLDKWMAAFWMLVNCKNGISSMEIHRALGVTQKTAWFMLQRIRLAMQEHGSLLKLGGHGGEVEVDETFIGGKARFMHRDKWKRKIGAYGNTGDKAIVFGVLDRNAKKVRTMMIPDRRTSTLAPILKDHVSAGSALFTDEMTTYRHMPMSDYEHKIVDHTQRYVDGRVHTNGLENFWSLLKRGLHGTYVSVEPFHLFRYLDEQAFRYNNRATRDNPLNDSDRFELAVSQIAGKRLTYKELTGKELEKPRPEAN
jgi:transposase-like protein